MYKLVLLVSLHFIYDEVARISRINKLMKQSNFTTTVLCTLFTPNLQNLTIKQRVVYLEHDQIDEYVCSQSCALCT